ncbi:MAG: efflux RND transporter periplasmic adaptor subunit [Parahaliea sp.]
MKKVLFGKRMWLILLLTALLFGGVIGMQWYGRKMMNEAMNNMPFAPVYVSTDEARAASWQNAVEAVGTLTSIQGAELATEVQGTIDNIYFDNGAQVKAGDVILRLNSDPDQAELAALKAAAELAAIEKRRANSLVASRNISKSELDQRASELDQAQARVKAQEARIEQKTLRAAYDGQLGIRRVNVGDYVQAGDTIIELQSLDKLYVNFSLPEQYSRDIATKMKVVVALPALKGEIFEGIITAISPVVDTDTRNFVVQATVGNHENLLRPGMVANISLPIGEREEQIIVPQTAIAYRSYGNSVYVLVPQGDGMSVEQRFVTLGTIRGDMIAVLEGLDAGETIATSGLLKLNPGAPVIIDNSVQPTSSLTPQPENG